MEYCALKFSDAGEIRVKGYGGNMIYYTVEAQLCDSEMWALLADAKTQKYRELIDYAHSR